MSGKRTKALRREAKRLFGRPPLLAGGWPREGNEFRRFTAGRPRVARDAPASDQRGSACLKFIGIGGNGSYERPPIRERRQVAEGHR